MSTTNVSPREMGTPCLQEGGDEAAKPRIAHTKGGRDGVERDNTRGSHNPGSGSPGDSLLTAVLLSEVTCSVSIGTTQLASMQMPARCQ